MILRFTTNSMMTERTFLADFETVPAFGMWANRGQTSETLLQQVSGNWGKASWWRRFLARIRGYRRKP
jgi:hypothetical protein